MSNIRRFTGLTREQVEFLVEFYDGFDFNFSAGYCSVEFDKDEVDEIERLLVEQKE